MFAFPGLGRKAGVAIVNELPASGLCCSLGNVLGFCFHGAGESQLAELSLIQMKSPFSQPKQQLQLTLSTLGVNLIFLGGSARLWQACWDHQKGSTCWGRRKGPTSLCRAASSMWLSQKQGCWRTPWEVKQRGEQDSVSQGGTAFSQGHSQERVLFM